MTFKVEFTVRDYECDLQGIVNNSVYFNYLEHARHEFLHANGVDFAQLAREMDYKQSLVPRDEFYVLVEPERVSRLKFGFRQTVVRKRDDKVMLKALVIGTSVNEQGRPFLPEKIETLFKYN